MAYGIKDFQCTENKKDTKYYAGDEWTKQSGGHRHLDVTQVFLQYELFVKSVRTRSKVNWQLEPSSSIELNDADWLRSGVYSSLHDIGREIMTSIATREKKRVIFTPSTGRHGRLDWFTDQASAMESSWRVVLVSDEEHADYADTLKYAPYYSRVNTILLSYTGECEQCVGFARFAILHIARTWRLENCWIIDDSVPVGEIKCTMWRDSEPERAHDADRQISFLDAMKVIEWDNSNACYPPAITGIPSSSSLWKLKKPKFLFQSSLDINATREPWYWYRRLHCGSLDIGSRMHAARLAKYYCCRIQSQPDARQFNERAATNFVFLNLRRINWDITYDHRLPIKEDIIFSARVINSGGGVMIYRNFHVDNRRCGSGDVSDHVPSRPTTPRGTSGTDSSTDDFTDGLADVSI